MHSDTHPQQTSYTVKAFKRVMKTRRQTNHGLAGIPAFGLCLSVRMSVHGQGSLVLINMQILTLSGFIKAEVRWISSPVSDIH